jgi:hypothetical protein
MNRYDPPAAPTVPRASKATESAIIATFSPTVRKGVFPKPELEIWQTLRAKVANLSKMESELTYDAARKAYRTHVETLTSHVASGDSSKFDATDGWTPTDWQEDFSERRRIVRQQRAAICREAFPIAKGIRARAAAAVLDLACEIEAGEKATAEKFSVPFCPSVVALTIRKFAADLVDPAQLPAGPSSLDELLPFVTF